MIFRIMCDKSNINNEEQGNPYSTISFVEFVLVAHSLLFYFRQNSTNKFYIIWYNILKGDDTMQEVLKEAYQKSLRIINDLNIQDEKQYKKIVKEYLILNIVSLRFMSQRNSFKDIITIAKEVD